MSSRATLQLLTGHAEEGEVSFEKAICQILFSLRGKGIPLSGEGIH